MTFQPPASLHAEPDLAAISPAAAVAAALHDGKTHLLLAASGSVATIKLPQIIQALAPHSNLSIRVILSDSATHFLAGQSAEQPNLTSLASLAHVDGVYTAADEWTTPWTRGAPILHIELRRWAQLLAVVPLSANGLAKMAGGLCDDLLMSVVRAWDTSRRGVDGGPAVVVAPAMNTMMWTHPVTAKQVAVLQEEWEWVQVLLPQEKALACGDVGQGGMREWREIVGVIEERLGLGRGLEGNMDSGDAA